MLERLARFSRTMALPLTAALLTALGAAGCVGADQDGSEVADDAVKNVDISATTLAKLGPSERLSVDLGARGVMYHFSVAEQLDFARIDLAFPAGKASMDAAFEAVFSSPYSPLDAASKQFVITADPADFAELTADDVQALRTERMISREHGAAAPKGQQQSVDNCVEQTIYFYVDLTIDGTVVSVPCAHTILVCDGTPVCTKQSFGGHDYLFCDNAQSWDDASVSCEGQGSTLLQLNDATEENWVYHVINGISTQKWWMGLNDRASEGTFSWHGGSPVTYSNFYAGEPNNAGGNEDCGQLNRFYPASGWNDEPCSLHLRYVCESN